MEASTISIQETQEAPKEQTSMIDNFSGLVPMILIFAVFYFLLIRPQEKKRKQQETLVSGVKKGEEVMTNSGFFGVVTEIDDSNNVVMLRVAKDVEMKILKNSITDIISRDRKEAKKIDKSDSNKKKPTTKKK